MRTLHLILVLFLLYLFLINYDYLNLVVSKAQLIEHSSHIVQSALHLAWTTWDSQVPSIPTHANALFEALLDLVNVCGASAKLSLRDIAAQLIDMDWHQKVSLESESENR